jgi:hypothetical protein
MSTIQVDSFGTFEETYHFNMPTESIARGKVLAWAHWTNSTTGLAPVLRNSSSNVTAITNVVRGRNLLTISPGLPTTRYTGRGMSFDNSTSTISAVFLDESQTNSTTQAYIAEVDLGTSFTLEGRSTSTSVVLIGG